MYSNTPKLLDDFEDHIIKKEPFSIIRMGDSCNLILTILFAEQKLQGFLKGKRRLARSYTSWKHRIVRGRFNMDKSKFEEFGKSLIFFCNKANYIDALVLDKEFQHLEPRRAGVDSLIFSRWREMYNFVGIKNKNYISYIANHFSILPDRKNIIDLMKGRNVFFINRGARHMVPKFSKICNNIGFFDVVANPGQQIKSGQYRKVFEVIKKEATNYDFFLIGAGMPGKGYCGYVKQCGGRAFDIGGVYRYWNGAQSLPPVLRKIVTMDKTRLLYKMR